ncbi:signal transduction histidine kinase [Rhodococcus sp. AG1013]|uniref:sensor histidine kinase n=1 Tax=Rhodococcus sp. AG1013 TaxID=2183996 RepID=UPI000E0C9C05|nr:sensor histidine kinase [Rhodococcus sp. AG1013]RDI23291.1 signal transduction histidine kinase [Rhodococcus sp. AG1013]
MNGSTSISPGLVPVARWRAATYVAATVTRTLLAVAASALLAAPILIATTEKDWGAERTGAFLVAGLAVLGVGLPLTSAVLAKTDWAAAAPLHDGAEAERPDIQLHEPKTLVRPIAYTVVMLTLGGAVAVLVLLAVIGSVVALFSPYLAITGDSAVIGPFTVTTVAHSLLAAAAGAALLTLLVWTSPALASAHARLVWQVLTRPEERLRHDLTATAQSRARLVRAFDVERRHIERDLHDAIQPQLLSVSMTLGLALTALPQDVPGRDDVVRAQQQARQTLDDLRRVVRNIHPQVLIDHGLGSAVREVADGFAIPVEVDERLGTRLAPDVETNLYFCVAELLSNVVKHSAASRVDILLHRPTPDQVHIVVRDDGCGGAGSQRREDGGLSGITDRLAALDGTLTIDSPLGGPTVITVAVPDGTAG